MCWALYSASRVPQFPLCDMWVSINVCSTWANWCSTESEKNTVITDKNSEYQSTIRTCHPFQCMWLQKSKSMWDGLHRWTGKHNAKMWGELDSTQFRGSSRGEQSCQRGDCKGRWGVWGVMDVNSSVVWHRRGKKREQMDDTKQQHRSLQLYSPGRFTHFTALQRKKRVVV